MRQAQVGSALIETPFMMSKAEFVSVVSSLVDAALLPELRCTFTAGCTCGWTSPMALDLAAMSVLASAVQNFIRGEKPSRHLLNAVQRLKQNQDSLSININVCQRSNTVDSDSDVGRFEFLGVLR